MTVNGTLQKLQAIDPVVLSDVVRQDQRDPDYEITDWAVRRLSDRGFASGDGPFCFYGQGRSGASVKHWSVVLKISTTPERALEDPASPWNFEREWLVYQSGLLDTLPGSLAVPRCYGIHEHADGTWMWTEHIAEKNGGCWGVEEFAFVARELGRFNGVYATGWPLPNEPWLSRGQLRPWMETWTPVGAWDSAAVQRAFTPQTRARVSRLWDERERFLVALDGLPQTFSHFDCMRRNLLIRSRPAAGDEVVAVDWAMCGIRPLGGDLSHLLGQSSAFYDWDPTDVASLEPVAESAYLAGLRDAGWQGDPSAIRLGYAAWMALWLGVTLPRGVAVFATEDGRAFLQQQFNRSPDEFACGWATLCDYALDRADEARQIMARLNVP